MIFFRTKKIRAFVGTAFAAGVSLCGISACGDAESRGEIVARERAAGFEAAFPVALGEKKLELRLALTELERMQGLTGCRGLAENAGMLFVYADDARRSFWMRGVPVDLSVGFFDAEGILIEAREMFAGDLRTTSSRSAHVRFVLEMSSGWFSRNGIAVGTRLDLSAVYAATRSRGFDFPSE